MQQPLHLCQLPVLPLQCPLSRPTPASSASASPSHALLRYQQYSAPAASSSTNSGRLSPSTFTLPCRCRDVLQDTQHSRIFGEHTRPPDCVMMIADRQLQQIVCKAIFVHNADIPCQYSYPS